MRNPYLQPHNAAATSFCSGVPGCGSAGKEPSFLEARLKEGDEEDSILESVPLDPLTHFPTLRYRR